MESLGFAIIVYEDDTAHAISYDREPLSSFRIEGEGTYGERFHVGIEVPSGPPGTARRRIWLGPFHNYFSGDNEIYYTCFEQTPWCSGAFVSEGNEPVRAEYSVTFLYLVHSMPLNWEQLIDDLRAGPYRDFLHMIVRV